MATSNNSGATVGKPSQPMIPAPESAAPTTEEELDEGPVWIHRVPHGTGVALCGFVFLPSNRVSLATAIGECAERCAECDVEYLYFLYYDLD